MVGRLDGRPGNHHAAFSHSSPCFPRWRPTQSDTVVCTVTPADEAFETKQFICCYAFIYLFFNRLNGFFAPADRTHLQSVTPRVFRRDLEVTTQCCPPAAAMFFPGSEQSLGRSLFASASVRNERGCHSCTHKLHDAMLHV